MVPSFVSRLWWRRYVRRNARPWRELEQFPRERADAQRRMLAARLLAQVRYFGRREDALPEWREAASIPDPDELWRVWPSLPVMTKDDLRSWMPPEQLRDRFQLAGRISATGGSTGEPTRFFHDSEMVLATIGAEEYSHRRMGWRPGMATVILWGSERDIGRLMGWQDRAHYLLARNVLVDGYRLDGVTVDRVLSAIRSYRPVAMYGFTSILEFVAREVLTRGNAPEPGVVRAAWSGGEMVFPQQVDLFRRAFGVPILNAYGGRELGGMAAQFEEGAALEVFRPWVFLEIVRGDGKPVGPGETGRIVCTSTINRGTPFLRYEVGDLASFAPHHQSESGIAALSELRGRIGSLLALPNGRTISPLYWNHLFKEQPEVRQFQVRLTDAGRLRLLLAGAGFSAEREAELLRKIRDFAGEMPVAIEWVDRIPVTPQGKLIQVLREETPVSL